MSKYHRVIAVLSKVLLAYLQKATPPENFLNEFNEITDSDSLTLNALKSIAEYVQMSWEKIGPLKRELEEAHEVDAEINMLEA